jgi:HlyD family secretion protein
MAGPNGQPSLKERVRELRLDDRLGSAKGHRSSSGWLPWALCFVLALSWAGVGIRWYRAQGSGAATRPGDGNGPAAQQAMPANDAKSAGQDAADETPTSGERVLERRGYIIAAHQIPISPIDVAGRIIELNFMEGDTKKTGDILAKIDPTSFQADKTEAEAQVAASKARHEELRIGWKHEILQTESDLGEAKAQMTEALLVYETSKNTSSGAVAKLEVNQNKKKYDALVQRVKSLEAKLALVQGESHQQKIIAAERDQAAAQARYDRAIWRLDNCCIKAPVTGVMLTKKAEFGSLINPVVGGLSTVLCEMADLSDLEVDLEVADRDLSKVFKGQECEVRVDAYPNRKYMGYVSRIMPIGNRGKAVLPIRIKVIVPPNEEQGKYLKPEMNASVFFFAKLAKEYRTATAAIDEKDGAVPAKKGNP